jgi:hypothetical protein
MAIELEVGKQYITRDGSEYTEPLKQLTGNTSGDFGYIATTYKIGTEVSTATRTWAHDGSWISSVENDLDLVAEYKPEEIKMIGKVIVNIEAGKTYRTREGKEVTLVSDDSYTLSGSNGFLYNKSLTGSIYSYENSDHDLVEEVVKEPVTSFTTQQEIYKYLVSGGYISCGGMDIFGFSEEGRLASFNIYGEFKYGANFTFNLPSCWQVATIEPKPVPRWEDALKDKKILCKVGYSEDDLYLVALIQDILSDADYPYESVDGNVYTFAKPLTLEEVTNYIYECE